MPAPLSDCCDYPNHLDSSLSALSAHTECPLNQFMLPFLCLAMGTVGAQVTSLGLHLIEGSDLVSKTN